MKDVKKTDKTEYYKTIRSVVSKQVFNSEDYQFLFTNPKLNDNFVMLGLGGSYAYGTYTEDSDLDMRGIARNSREEILLGTDFEQVQDMKTDTVVYSVKKFIRLLQNNNPNIMEMVGLMPTQLLYSDEIYQMILESKEIFLSKLAAYTFGGYANQQLRRLETKAARNGGQAQKEAYILGSIHSAEYLFKERCARMPEDALKLYIDASDKEDMESEIFMDVTLSHYPLRDFSSLIAEYRQIVTGYDKLGRRNQKAIEHGKLGKHMMHLVRLYHMAFEILEDGVIQTYREKDRDFLLEIRNGKYLEESTNILPEFYEIVEEYDERLKKAAQHCDLPERPDNAAVEKLLMRINEKILDEE